MTDPTTSSAPAWYGEDASFWYPLERGARDHFTRMRADGRGADRLHFEPGHDVLTYRVTGMHVPGYVEVHDVTVEFHRHPRYPTGRLHPQDYPLVFTSVERPYYHHHGKAGPFRGSLCLWHPNDPRATRWASDQPLHDLFEMARRHLFHEEYYARYGHWPVAHHYHRPARSVA